MIRSTRGSTFEGYRVRALRKSLALNQREMALALSISVSYLSQIESGDRPVTGTVLRSLAQQFPVDWEMTDPHEGDQLSLSVMEACSDASVADTLTDMRDVERIIRQNPRIARRLVALHKAHQLDQSQLKVLDDHLQADGGNAAQLPWEQVRDWFHVQQNYIDEIDRRSEQMYESLDGPSISQAIQSRLLERHGVQIEALRSGENVIRDFDGRTLRIDPAQPAESRLFSLSHQLARLELGDLISDIVERRMDPGVGRQLLSAGIANYAAGALLMPYAAFRQAARDYRHDIDRLRRQFGTSFEQTCHRLSTLQRPGALGVPMFFCRVDMAGNITKRHSATRLEFARFGGACPLWIVHEAVAIPDRVLVQLSEMPDGVRYVSMAMGLVKPSDRYTRSPRRYAVALGCEEKYASEFIYSDGLRTGGSATPIGSSCRICSRTSCDQRAFPPAAGHFRIDPDRRGLTPYELIAV